MSTLTQTAITARRAVRYSIYAIVLLLVGRVVLGGVLGVYRYFFPEPPPAATILFGRLPSLPFPDNKTDPTSLTYTLQTPEGGFPKLPTQSKVYYMPREQSTLVSVEQGLNKGKLLGFDGSGEQITETVYRFKHGVFPKVLEINVVSNIFSLSYDLAADPSAIDTIPPAPEVGASQIRSYLSSAALLPADLLGPISHEFLRVEQGKLVSAISLSEAHLVKVNLSRTSYDELPSLGPNTAETNVWFLVSGSRQVEKRILSGEFHYTPIDPERGSTYPIKTPELAWQDLNAGKAYIAKAPADGSTNIVVRRVYLANYDPDVSAEFFQPIIVFEGDGFLAYVPAVTSEYYGE